MLIGSVGQRVLLLLNQRFLLLPGTVEGKLKAAVYVKFSKKQQRLLDLN